MVRLMMAVVLFVGVVVLAGQGVCQGPVAGGVDGAGGAGGVGVITPGAWPKGKEDAVAPAGCVVYPVVPLCPQLSGRPLAQTATTATAEALAGAVAPLMRAFSGHACSLHGGCVDVAGGTARAASHGCVEAIREYACAAAGAEPRHGVEVRHADTGRTQCSLAPAYPSSDSCHAVFDACRVEKVSVPAAGGLVRSLSRQQLCEPGAADTTWIQPTV